MIKFKVFLFCTFKLYPLSLPKFCEEEFHDE